MLHALSQSLSIVIPAPADPGALEETLLSVLENRPHDCQVVVAVGFPYDDPWNVSAEGVSFVQAPRGDLAVCATVGIAATTGSVVHVLAAGWQATPGWTDGVLPLFDAAGTGAVVPLAVAKVDRERVVSAGMRYRRGGRRVALARPGRGMAVGAGAEGRVGARPPLGVVVGPRLEAGFWRGDVLRDVRGGVSTVCGARLADADLAVELAARGLATVVAEGARVVAGGEPAREGAFRAGLHAERLFWRSIGGRSLLPALLLHGVEVVRHAVMTAPLGTLPMLAGRLLAALQVGSYLPRYRRLVSLVAEGAVGAGDPERVLEAGDRGGVAEAAEEGRDRERGGTIRIDAGHEAVSRPRHRVAPAEPLRKSA